MGLEIKTTANRESTWSITSKITDKLRHHKRTVTILRKQWKKFETRSTFHIFSIVFKSSCWTQITYEYSFFQFDLLLTSFIFHTFSPVSNQWSCSTWRCWSPPTVPIKFVMWLFLLNATTEIFFKIADEALRKKKLLTYLFILKKSIIQFLIKCFGLFSKLQVNQSKKRCI